MDLSQVTPVGLVTLVLLGICSVLMLAIAIERWYIYHRMAVDPDWLHGKMVYFLQQKKVDDARVYLRDVRGCLPRVFEIGLNRFHLSQEEVEAAMGNAISEQKLFLERNLQAIGTIAVISPFIGLFGTVVGIMHTFSAVAEKGQAGVAVVAAGVAEALIATAAGLFVAIAAVVFFNYFKTRVSGFVVQMTTAATRLSEMIELVRTDRPFPQDLFELAGAPVQASVQHAANPGPPTPGRS